MDSYPKQPTSEIDFLEIEEAFSKFIKLKNLDLYIKENPEKAAIFEKLINIAVCEAYDDGDGCPQAHLFLQRILYNINRLKLFWYDDLDNYTNEDSSFLFSIRSQVEKESQDWEINHLDIESFKESNIINTLHTRVAEDLNPKPLKDDLYIRNGISETGYRRLLAIASLNGLVEASQLSRVLGGVGNEVQSMLTRIFLEEYGGGKLPRKHSSFFTTMLKEFDMNTRPEAYLDLVPWSTLANINHSFTLSEHKRCFLRYVGGLLFTEVTTPAVFKNFKLAGERLGFSENAVGYWDLHMKEDERHGQWMLDDVAIPLAVQYRDRAWEILLGYEQQRFLNIRAGKDVAESIRQGQDVRDFPLK